MDHINYRNRRIGTSTKLADRYIQQLFTTGRVFIKDHYPGRDADIFLWDKIIRRLEIEHQQSFKDMIFNKDRLSIKYKDSL